ncbi:homoserine kinase [soil metagenome]
MRWTETPVAVRTPASSANLGPGFDSFGLALALHDDVEVAVTPAGLHVDVAGEGAHEVPRDEQHLVVRAARATFDALGKQPPGLRLRCRNRVPHGRGLGSSAAAIVAGVVAARALVENSEPGAGAGLDADAALLLAAELEGHPDNVAAALLGGCTLAWTEQAGARAIRLDPVVSAVVLVPARPLSTELARGLLPAQVPHRAAVANSARAALLTVAMTTRPDLLLAATEDLLHQDYREPAMPASLALVRRLRTAGRAAVVSGAGPAVLVLVAATAAGAPPAAGLVGELAGAAPGWQPQPLAVDMDGAAIPG